jgi:ABC-2 type transport system permease protein
MIVEQNKAVSELMKGLPAEFMKAFNITATTMNTFEGYLTSKHYPSTWIIFLLIVLLPAATAISKDIDKRNAELLLSQPLSRSKVLLAKYFAGLANTVVFTILSIILVIPICLLGNITPLYANYFTLAISSSFFTMAIYSLAFAMGAAFNEPTKPTLFTIGFILASYMVNVIAMIVKDLEVFKYLSVFYYYDTSKALIDNSLDLTGVLIFTVISIVALVFSLKVFNYKDIP